MLKKLFYYEWKDTWKLMAILNGVVFFLGISGMFLFQHDRISRMFESSHKGSAALAAMSVSYIFVYFLGMAVVTVGSQIYFYIRFYQQLYTDQGYLMHTLPVNSHQLILSKTFVAMLWRIISTLVCSVSVVLLLIAAFGQERDEVFSDLAEEFSGLHLSNGIALLILLLSIIATIGSLLFQTYTGYLAISIGQQIGKNKVLSSVGIYIGIRIVINLITNIVSQTFTFSMAYGQGKWFQSGWEPTEGTVVLIFLLVDIILIGISVGMYFLIHHFMSKKLNLD